MTTTSKKKSLPQRLTALQAGADKDLTGKATLSIGGSPMTSAQIDTTIGGYLKPYGDLATGQTQVKAARATIKAQQLAAQKFATDMTASVKGTYGPSNPIVEDYGLTPAKAPAVQTSEQKAAAAAKRNATRKLRGTLGPKQKAALKSTAPVVVTYALGTEAQAPVVGAPAAAAPAANGPSAPAPAPAVAGNGTAH